MRIPLNSFSFASKFAAILIGAGILASVAPALAQQPQEDVLLPAADAPAETPDVPDVTPDPSTLTAPVDPSQAAEAEDAMDDLLKKIDEGGAKVEQPPPTVPEVTPEVVDGNAAIAPPAETLAAPTDAKPDTAVVVTPGAATDVTEIPALPANEKADENLFFDANTLVPTGEMGSGGPRKVNPALQPASKLIVVKKDYAPSSREAQLVSAQRAVTLGRYDAALEMYNALYAKNKRDPNILMGRAVSMQHLGNIDEAIAAYQELLDLRPDNTEAQVNMLGLMGQRYPAVGLQRLLELREKDPNNVSIVGQIAVMQANMGQYDEAFKYLGMAASMEPNNANHLYNMAVIADRAGKKDQAIKYYEDALETDSIYGGGSSIPRESVMDRLARLR